METGLVVPMKGVELCSFCRRIMPTSSVVADFLTVLMSWHSTLPPRIPTISSCTVFALTSLYPVLSTADLMCGLILSFCWMSWQWLSPPPRIPTVDRKVYPRSRYIQKSLFWLLYLQLLGFIVSSAYDSPHGEQARTCSRFGWRGDGGSPWAGPNQGGVLPRKCRLLKNTFRAENLKSSNLTQSNSHTFK